MKYPRHLWIIADWNRTRAKEQWLTGMDWHFAWAKRTLELLEYIFTHTPVEVVTGWFLSTENLKERSPEEVTFIFSILKMLWNDMDEFLAKNRVNFYRVGNKQWLPEDVIEFLDNKQKIFTFTDSVRKAVFAINYWGRDEIIRWIKNIPTENIQSLTEEEFTKVLDFWPIQPLDMVIRTKWDKAHRTSWFMSRWIWYAELYFAKEYYPALSNEKLEEAFTRFDSVAENRNYGK
jgi:short-chain Z-isoprenyl diphosphate synthase